MKKKVEENHTFQPLLLHDHLYQTPSEIYVILASNYAHITMTLNFSSEKLLKKPPQSSSTPLLITVTSLLPKIKCTGQFSNVLNSLKISQSSQKIKIMRHVFQVVSLGFSRNSSKFQNLLREKHRIFPCL